VPHAQVSRSLSPSEATQAGWLDAEQFTELTRVALRALRRLGVQEESLSDAAQDALLVVHRRRDDFRGEATVRTWLYGIVLRVASDYRRKSRRQQAFFRVGEETFAEQVPCSAPSPFERLEQRAAQRLLHALLEELPEQLRAVFVLVELEELQISDAASALEIPTTTCKSRLRTARRLFEAAVMRERSRLQHQEEPCP
jgi:RNA polymerase sigma-70 factor, ECF subfamily